MPYLTLDAIPEGRLCRPLFIPDDPLWLALFGGALTETTKVWNYQQFGTLTPEEMAEACELIVAQWYEEICGTCELPDGDRIVRINEDNVWEELDNGVWQPTTGDYFIPPPDAREEPTADERRCLAAANATNTLQIMYEELTDLFGEALGTIEALADWAGLIGAAIIPGLGLAVRALLTIGVIAFKEVFDFTEFITADFWTSTFTDNMRCTLYECATDTAGVVTFDFDCVWERIKGQIEWLDPTIASAALAGQVLFMLNSIGAQGLNLAGATTAIEVADCSECGVLHCYELDFMVSSHSGEFTISGGSYSSGVGYVGTGGSAPNFQDVYGYWTFPEDIQIAEYQMDYSKGAGSGANNQNRLVLLGSPVVNYTTPQIDQNTFNAFGNNLTKGSSYSGMAGGLGFDVNTGDSNSYVYIHALRVYYYGDIPAGWSDNCED